MNNEPVAWMYETELQDGTTVKRVSGAWESKYKHISDICDRGYPVPLYTHPAETITLAELRQTELYRKEQTRYLREFLEPKTLTDDEIHDIADKFIERFEYEPWTVDVIGFARAILRKAQEK